MRKIIYKVLDLSHWNTVTDWKAIVEDGYKGVILKVGGSDGANKYYKDKKFEEYYTKAKEVGLLVGGYWFCGSQINNGVKGVQDALYFLECIKGKQFELPLWCDYEIGNPKTRKANTDAVELFCMTMEGHSYFIGIYGSDFNTFEYQLDSKRLTRFAWWVAKYSTKEPNHKCGLWQYTSTGKVKGIKGNVDISNVYLEYSEVIKAVKLNGFS